MNTQPIGVNDLYIAVGVDPIECAIYLIEIGDEETCSKTNSPEQTFNGKPIEITYFNVFCFGGSEHLSKRIYEWFKGCGMTTSDASRSVRNFGESLSSVLFKEQDE